MPRPSPRRIAATLLVIGTVAPAARAQPAPLPAGAAPVANRVKALQTSVGLPPSALDLGSEADILGVRDTREMAAVLDRWSFSMKGSLRAPIRIGFGPRNDGLDGVEAHALPRIVGLASGDWNYVGLAPNASASLRLTVGNPIVSGSIIMSTSHLWDASYPVIDDIGLDQAYLTFKFPTAFGRKGGLALTAGIFSERFGTAGPYQKSSGYYSTYLFGRTHQAGHSLTADIDLTDDWELILEEGLGAKTEVVPFFSNQGPGVDGPPEQDFFPGQQAQPYGSTFVAHAHAGLLYKDKLRIAAHYLTSWSPDDNTLVPSGDVPAARMQSLGAEIHVDDELYNGYLGYGRIIADNLYPLSDALQVIHSGSGRAFKLNYLGQKDRFTGITPNNTSGTVDTLLGQVLLRVAPLIGDPFGSRDLNVAVYSMYNHARSPRPDNVDPADLAYLDIKDDKVKIGADVDLSILRFMSLGARFDRVIPTLADTSDAYTALSPRVTFYTKWKSKEMVIVQYTHFFLGPRTVPGSPYTDGFYEPDTDMLVVTGRMSF